ncbi:tectonin beta-propeller repeat-containing protein 2-like [Uloborus diversus]|uniref:tectonin beta-propeller repeat-containing protein 2-like n=1 Tax=Uloborus diversus TaxID=327109 RepID=UPI002409D2CB|nr:tectonin beta-propeller repeat-containing protein 2-like [Uloborus diversus]
MSENEYSALGYPWLQEFPLESDFLKHIPARAQRGLTTFDLVLSCLDVDGSYIALGSNVGIVYLFDRKRGCLQKLKDEFKDEVTCVKLLLSLECLVAVGFKNGHVLIFRVPFIQENELENSKLEKFQIKGLHTSAITALEWSTNGTTIYSGDQNGLVVCTEIDHLERQSRSKALREEGNQVLQLSCNKYFLVISTVFRSLVFSLNHDTCVQIGQKERKRFGPFGAILFEKDSHDQTVFASRPGQRLWRSDTSGFIHETMIFKDALCDPKLPLLPLSSSTNVPCDPSEIQFGPLAVYDYRYVLVWSDSAVLLIDPEQKSVIGCSPKLDPVLGVATSGNEIFILRGLREIVRVSPQPDPFCGVKIPEEPSLVDEILVPLKGLSTFMRERSDSLSLQVNASSDLFGWLRKKRSESSPTVLEQEIELESEDTKLPEIVNLSFEDCIPVQLEAEANRPRIKIEEPLESEYDDIVFKPKKKKKKKVRFSNDTKSNDGKQSLVIVEQVETSSEKSSGTSVTKHNSIDENGQSSPSEIVNCSDTSDDASTPSPEIIMPNESNCVDANQNFSDNQPLQNTLNGSLEHVENQITDQTDTINNNNSSVEISEFEESMQFEGENVLNENDLNQNYLNKCDNSSQPKDQELDPFDIYSLSDSSKDVQSNPSTAVVEKNTPEAPTNQDSLTSSTDSLTTEPPKYGVDWVEYKAPEMLLDLCTSNDHIFCVDIRNQLYFSKYPVLGLHWIELPQPAEKIASSPSESIVWALYRGTVFGVVQKAKLLWLDTEWMSVARDVISIAVEDDCGWYVSSTGKLLVQRNLTSSQPYGYPEKVPCKYVISQVAAKNGVVWALSEGGCLYCCKSLNSKTQYQWKQIVIQEAVDIDTIHLGEQKTGWMVDSAGIILFKIGVMSENPAGIEKSWQVESSSYLVQHANGRQKLPKISVNSEMLTNLIRGKQHICLSTSTFGVWFCKTFDHLVYSNQRNIIGHAWEQVIPPSTASTTKWNMIATTNAVNSEGALWCVNSNGELFCYCLSSKAIYAVELPPISRIKCLQQCDQSLWLLSEEGTIYIRRGITPTCQQGMFWQPLDTKELGSYQIKNISCSHNVVWGCTAEGQALLRLGSLNPSPNSVLLQAWFPIDNEEELEAVKIYVGPLGYPVWIIDSRRNVYAREKVSSSFPFGEKWTLVPELQAQELCISRGAVWLLTESGKIYRRFGVTERNPCGDYWKQMPGLMDHLTVTESDDLWGLRDGSIFCHSSFVLNYSQKATERIPVRSISEDDWEDITADEYGDDT